MKLVNNISNTLPDKISINKAMKITLLGLLCIFIINPFICFILSLTILYQYNVREDRSKYFFVIALFLGFVAFTQNTKTGDLSRTYEDILNGNSLIKYDLLFFILSSKHVLYDLVNQTIYTFMGDVRFVALFWIFILYYMTFKSISNLEEYESVTLDNKKLFSLVLYVVFCFTIFTQVTELMKQGVATALFLFAYTSFLIRKKIRAMIWFVIALNIHFSILFFLPILFAGILSKKVALLCVLVSFSFRGFGLMEFFFSKMSSLTGVNDLFLVGSIVSSSEALQNQMDGFFKSDSPFFLIIFWSFFLLSLFILYYSHRGLLVKSCLIIVMVLNLTYADNHNYTRLLTMLFPFYIFLFFEIRSIKAKGARSLILKLLVLSTFFVNARIFFARVLMGEYGTAYLNNSLINLFSYPSFMYLI